VFLVDKADLDSGWHPHNRVALIGETNKLFERTSNTEQRRTRKHHFYGGDYRKRRAEVLANATHCHLCKQPLTLTDQIETDHLVAGDPNSPLAPAHRVCNQRRGNKPLA
jgi:hypothetical protein